MGERAWFSLVGVAGAALTAGLIWFNAASAPKPLGVEVTALPAYASSAQPEDPEPQGKKVPPEQCPAASGAQPEDPEPQGKIVPPEQCPATASGPPTLYAYPELEGLRIPVNRATVEELTQLPGIGEVKAQAIRDYIRQHGPISDPSQLINVKGIGEKTVERIRPYLVFEESGEASSSPCPSDLGDGPTP